MTDLVPMPQDGDVTERAAYVFRLVESWLFREPMAELLAAFGERLPARWSAAPDPARLTGWLHLNEELPGWLRQVTAGADADVKGLSPEQMDTVARTLAVERIAASEFHFRSERGTEYSERSQAVTANFDDAFRDRVLDLARQLGLLTPSSPRHPRYDTTLVLGAGYRSPLLRARYAKRFETAGVDLGELSFLGSPRSLIEPEEPPLVRDYAPGATDEFDLVIAAARAEFGLVGKTVTFLCGCLSADAICPVWKYAAVNPAKPPPPAYTHERRADLLDPDGRTRGSVLSASTSRPPVRPDTSDTFGLWARCVHPRPGQRLLVVTTQVFVPFQTFDGLRRLYLPYGMDIDTVGYSTDLGAEWTDRPQTAEYLLQETLSAIRSGRRLLVAAAEALISAVGTV